MCLYSKNKLREAKRDIKCYKVLKYFRRLNYLRTPFAKFPVDITKKLKAEGLDSVILDENKIFIYGEGYIHTYKNIGDALSCMDHLNFTKPNSDIEYKIYKCIIPKGTLYVKGNAYNTRTSYASKEIKFIKEIVI